MTFRPEIPIAKKRERVIDNLQTVAQPNLFNPRGVYDGRNLFYISHTLNLPGGGTGTFTVNLGNSNSGRGVFEVRLARTSSVVVRPSHVQKAISNEAHLGDPKVATAINVLNLLLRQAFKENYPTNYGGSFFGPAGMQPVQGSGIELWRGFFQSVRPTLGKLLVTVDVAMAAVYQSGRVLDIAGTLLNIRDVRQLHLADERDLRKLQVYFKNRQVICRTTGNATKTIYEIVRGPIGEYRFEIEQNGSRYITTIAEHLLRAHNITLGYPGSFGVRISGASAPFPVILPAECVKVIPGQPYKKRLPANVTDAAVQFATMKPRQRYEAITGGHNPQIPSPIHGFANSQYIIQSGMQINQRPIELQAKIIDAPQIRFARSSKRPKNGVWNLLDQTFKNSTNMRAWGFVNFEYGIQQDAVRMMKVLVECCQKLGMDIDVPAAFIQAGNIQAAEKDLDRLRSDIFQRAKKVDMIIVLLPARADETRHIVKYWGDVKNGIRTSCLREDKLRKALKQWKDKGDSQVTNQVCRLNARMGGQYAVPEFQEIRQLQLAGEFLIMGTDVSHPSPGSNRPSIASLVWSTNPEATSYVAYTSVQPSRVEIIQELKEMVKRALRDFANHPRNPRPPKTIIIFRDGCSEGEIQAVRAAEVTAIQDACREVWANAKLDVKKFPYPKLTFIVVVKRHHTVFFPKDPQNPRSADKNGNCLAGLAVERLRSPMIPGFFLQSHAPILGTARPAQYSILHDDNYNFDCPRIQQLSFELTHVYAKATRSISIPAPTYYADIVCGRAKFHFDPALYGNFDGASSDGGQEEQFNWQQAFKPVSQENYYDKTMYFL
ncbi:argonaute-like protein [Roridomyces roridus]|uniref:Argonaute-like protein n=1 Tax=Roridomyces roridus TaxID=1738132 RepID=A0AAD7BWS8_9AGAR|nr:argonaute-like protein [Roridomyces roridus]